MKRSLWIALITVNAFVCLLMLIGLTTDPAAASTPPELLDNVATLPDVAKEQEAKTAVLPPGASIDVDTWAIGALATGNNHVYHIAYANWGSIAAENSIITETLPAGMVFISQTSSFTFYQSGNNLLWELGSVPPSDSNYFDVFVSITASTGTMIDRMVFMTTTVSNTSPITTYTSPWSGKVITNDSDLSPYVYPLVEDPAPDSDYLYILSVCNNGSTDSGPSSLRLKVEGNTTIEDWTALEPGWAEIVHNNETIILTRPSSSGYTCKDVATIQTTLDSNATSGDYITATIAVTTPTDVNLFNNIVTYTHMVGTPRYDLGVTQNWIRGELYPGGYIDYKLQYYNDGNLPIENVLITNTIPNDTVFNYAQQYLLTDVVPFSPTINGNILIWEIDRLESGQLAEFDLSLLIDGNAIPGSPLWNYVEIESIAGEETYDNNFSSLGDTVYPFGPNLRVRKTGYWDTMSDRRIVYLIHVDNVGTNTFYNVPVTDTYPANWELGPLFDTETWKLLNFHNDSATHTFTATYDYLSPGESIHIKYDIELTSTFPIPNIVTNTVQTDIWLTETILVDNWSILPLTRPIVSDTADIELSKYAPSVVTESFFVYELSVINSGPNTATSINMLDSLPPEVTFANVTWDGPMNCNYTVATHAVNCDIPLLNVNTSYPITIFVNAVTTGTIVNTAIAQAIEFDPYLLNNTSSATTTVSLTLPESDLEVFADAPEEVMVGEFFTYSLAVMNQGPDGVSEVQLTDNFPNRVSIVNVIPSPIANCSPGGPNDMICDVPFLDNGAWFSVTVIAQANFPGTAVNTANVLPIVNDPEPLNNSTTITTEIKGQIPVTADLSLTKTVNLEYASVGDQLTYIITLTNHSDETITDVAFVDLLPYELDSLAFTTDAHTSCDTDTPQHFGYLVCQATLSANTFVNVTITGVISEPAIIVNVAFIESAPVFDLNPENDFAIAATFALEGDGPYIFRIDPPSGINTQPTILEIDGANFEPDTAVYLDNLELTTNFVNFDFIEAGVPADLTPGAYDVTVINSDGLSDTWPEAFYVYGPSGTPEIYFIEPDYGDSNLPVIIEIFGNNFIPGMTGYLSSIDDTRTPNSDIDLLDIYYIDSTYMWATLPPGVPAGTYDLTLATPDGQSATLPAAYLSVDFEAIEELYALEGDLWTEPLAPRAEREALVGLHVRRFTFLTTSLTVTVDFYDGQPGDSGATLINRETVNGFELYNDEELITTTWTPTSPGLHTLYAVIDPDNDVVELFEDDNVISYTLRVRRNEGDDITPVIDSFTINNGSLTTVEDRILCNVVASVPTRSNGTTTPSYILYVDFIFRQNVGDWVPVKDSGWRNYDEASSDFLWGISPEPGIHYILVLVADEFGNVSEPEIQFVNYFPDTDTFIAPGQGHVYRWLSPEDTNIEVRLTSRTGNADLHIWDDNNQLVGFSENPTDNNPSPVDSVVFTAEAGRLYQVEVTGISNNTTYRLEVEQTQSQVTTRPWRPRASPLFGVGETPDGTTGTPLLPQGANNFIFLPLFFN